MKPWSALVAFITISVTATLAAQAPVISSLEAPYAALQNSASIHLAGNTYGAGTVAYGPHGTPLVLTGDDLGETGVVKFVSYYYNTSTHSEAQGASATATVSLWTPTIIILTVPSNANSGLVVVTNPVGSSNGVPFVVTSGTYPNSCPALPSTSQLQILTAEIDDGMVSTAYSFKLQATGGTGAYTWSTVPSALPAGLSLNGSTGVISGTPTAAGTTQLSVQVKDSGSPPQINVAVLDLTIDTSGQAASSMPLYNFAIANGSNSGYDPVGNVVSYTDSVTGAWSSVTYDSLNRLARATQSANSQSQYFCWQYDAFGNWQQQQISSATFTSGGGSAACAAQTGASLATFWNSYTDSNNNDPGTNRVLSSNSSGIAVTLTYDNAGNVSDDGNHSYLYDGEGRICAVKYEAVAGFASMTQYIYDADGNRVAKGTITDWSKGCDTTQNGFTAQTVFVLGRSGEQLTEMNNVAGVWQWQHTNVMAGSLSATYANDNVASAAGSVYFHLSDWLGTRRQQTDYAGNPVETFSSLPYGDELDPELDASAPDGVTDATEHHFTGKERDTESGNDYFGARYYGSSMGRWLSPDPSGLELADPENPQGLNLYSYVLNNPLGFIDPDGMECVWDDGSFDSATDKQTGSSKSCSKAGGTWIDPKAFSTLNAGDWSDKANANIAGIAQDLNSSSTTVTVTAQDPGVVGALPLETPQAPQQIDPIKQLAIGITVDSQHSFGCIAQAYGFGVPGTAAYQLGQPVAGTKRFISPGSSIGTSPISDALSKAIPVKGSFRAPVGGPGTGVPFRMTKTGNLGRAIGRWAPFVGLAADAYAAAQLGKCL